MHLVYPQHKQYRDQWPGCHLSEDYSNCYTYSIWPNDMNLHINTWTYTLTHEPTHEPTLNLFFILWHELDWSVICLMSSSGTIDTVDIYYINILVYIIKNIVFVTLWSNFSLLPCKTSNTYIHKFHYTSLYLLHNYIVLQIRSH